MLNFLIFCSTILWVCSVQAGEATLQVVSAHGEKSYSLSELKKNLQTVSWTVSDPVFKKQKTYDGFPLSKVLELAGSSVEQGDELIFQAMDGYAPTISLSAAKNHEAIIAFQEHGNKKIWDKLQQGKSWVSPAPFYLVWKEGDQLPENFPWSYQLVRIELVNFSQKYSKLFPQGEKKDSAVYHGFESFKDRCLRCHSLNLQGGELAPELNIPKNITEYWSHDDLRAFIYDVSKYRLKSKMPVFRESLKSSELDDIITYLRFMKDHKIMSQ